MKVKSLIGSHAGNVIEVPHHVGQTLIDMGQAEAVAEEAPADVEHAIEEPSERAVDRPARRRR